MSCRSNSSRKVGRTPWSARVPLDPHLAMEIQPLAIPGRPAGGPAADQGVRPTFRSERGSVAVWLAVILAPVLLGLLGFALDLGMLYSSRSEIKTAASAMALATAQQLIGTDTATAAAQAQGLYTVQNSAVPGNKYYFQGMPIGVTTGTLVSTIADPAYYATAADAIASGDATNGGSVSQAASAQAKYVRITITGETPLVFWSLLPLATSHKLATLATAVAGQSAPLCLACGIEPFAVAAIDQTDTTDFGFTVNTIYSFAYSCTVVVPPPPGSPPSAPPPILGGGSALLYYVMLNRLNTNDTVFPAENSQAFQDAAGGLPGSTSTAQACFMVNNTESIWLDAAVNRCGVTVASVITSALCGLDARFESVSAVGACSTALGGDFETLSPIYQPDTDVNTYTAYTDYQGNGRRIITIPIVDSIANTTSMTVLGYRQFLLIPDASANVEGSSNDTDLQPGDTYGRFLGMYIGSVAPVPAGRFDGCTQAAGPGKVVLHQ